MPWQGLIQRRLWGRFLWTWLAAVAMMMLSAYLFFLWLEHMAIGFKILAETRGEPIEILPRIIGGTCLYWGGAQALIAFAAFLLGTDVRGVPHGSSFLPQGVRWEWVLALSGTLFCILIPGIVFLIAAIAQAR